MKRFREWDSARFVGGKWSALAGCLVLILIGCGEKRPGGPTPPLTPPRPVTAFIDIDPASATGLMAVDKFGQGRK